MMTQSDSVRTNHIKVNIDRTLQNRKCICYEDIDETVIQKPARYLQLKIYLNYHQMSSSLIRN